MTETEAPGRPTGTAAKKWPELSEACRDQLRELVDGYCRDPAARAELYPALVDLIRSELLGYEQLIVRIDKAVNELMIAEVLQLRQRLRRRWWPW
jgi:hypothetical protein